MKTNISHTDPAGFEIRKKVVLVLVINIGECFVPCCSIPYKLIKIKRRDDCKWIFSFLFSFWEVRNKLLQKSLWMIQNGAMEAKTWQNLSQFCLLFFFIFNFVFVFLPLESFRSLVRSPFGILCFDEAESFFEQTFENFLFWNG